jgi:hypothetical protein
MKNIPAACLYFKFLFTGEAPWSSGERQGLTVWAMVLGRGFNSQVRLKTRWIRWTTWWQKKNENNKDSQKGQVKPEIFFLQVSVYNFFEERQ